MLHPLALAAVALAAEAAPTPRPAPAEVMPITGLPAAKYVDGLCLYRYPVGTRSEECRRFCDQAFGYYYSYVWMEAARCFETALRHDPDCPLAWLGLHRSLEKWGKTTARPNAYLALAGGVGRPNLPDRLRAAPHDYALDRAKALLPRASHREGMLITSRLQEKGMLPGVAPDERKRKAVATLDEMLSVYPEDEEGWYARAQLAGSGESPPTAGGYAAIPFYKALLRINPLHPGANHELVHIYENVRRPALGWEHAERYMQSSPKIPHPFHMQAHLAMRVGKWRQTTDWSIEAVGLEKAYHRDLGVDPKDDHQYRHHLEILTRSLVHDGRFAEAKAIRSEAERLGWDFRPEWFRMALAEHDWAAAERLVAEFRKGDKATGAYHAALLALERGDAGRATAEADVLRQAPVKRSDRRHELRLNEVQGRLAAAAGDPAGGLKLVRRTIDRTKDDYAHHAWAGGAYYMEAWGEAALAAGVAAEAEEAFQEALAHDAGCVRGAVGLWALCDRIGRTDEAARYLKVARRCWAKADAGALDRLQADFARKARAVAGPAAITAAGGQ